MEVVKFQIEESKVNKGMKILIAVAESGERFVVGGDTYYCTALVPYDACFNSIGEAAFKKLSEPKNKS